MMTRHPVPLDPVKHLSPEFFIVGGICCLVSMTLNRDSIYCSFSSALFDTLAANQQATPSHIGT